jgi:hypothetical protein
MNKFEIKDEQAKEEFKEWCGYQSWCRFNKKSKVGFATWDVSYYSGNSKTEIAIVGEIKVREGYESNTFDSWYLEEKKYKSLQQIKEKVKGDLKIHYINIYPDSMIRIWDITEINNKMTVQRNLNKTKYGNTDEINKEVYLMYNDESTIYSTSDIKLLKWFNTK